MLKLNPILLLFCLALTALVPIFRPALAADLATFNVKDFGATGRKTDDAHAAIQKAVDACAAAGGGMVYLPPGEYSSGTITLKSHVRFHIEAGATLFASLNRSTFDKGALFYGEGLENITLEGRGLVDGQATYDWRLNDHDDDFIRPNLVLMETLRKPLMRPFPKDHPKETNFPRMVLLVRCKDVRITELSFVRSPSWNIHPYGCERVVIDGVYIQSSLREGVWADGIDPDGCKDVRISNSTIETGDDAIVFYSVDAYGPALPCENITVTNCRISSASSALKFCDGNRNSIRKVTVDNCVITSSNRGIAFMNFDHGYVSDVVLSNLTIETKLHDWFWWGDGEALHFNVKRRSEIHASVPKFPVQPIGAIRNVIIRNVIARGNGSSVILGHPESYLENVTFDNIRLFLSAVPEHPMQKAEHALKIRWARNLKLRDIEVHWEKPASEKWQSALYLEDIQGLELEGFSGRPGTVQFPAVVLNQVEDATIRNTRVEPGTTVFLDVKGEKTRGIGLIGNDFRKAKTPYQTTSGARKSEVVAVNNLGAQPVQ
jgi:Glycosyl hydrolases family 28/Pectate lyase superfamily protein